MHMCVYAYVYVCLWSMIRVNSWIWVRRGLKDMYQTEAIMSTDSLRQEYVGWGQGTHRNLVLELELASVEQTKKKAGLLNIQDFRGHFKDSFFTLRWEVTGKIERECHDLTHILKNSLLMLCEKTLQGKKLVRRLLQL